MNVSCWEEVTPEPFDHVVMSCCLPGGGKKKERKKKKSIVCGSLWRCEFSSQVAFTSLCRRKRRF